MKNNLIKNNQGFTLTELLIAIVISLLIFLIVSSTFILNQRVFRKSNIKAELAQNARISIDLMTREIRQAKTFVTTVPSNEASAVHEIEFEDGHTDYQIQYIRYYLEDTNLKRQIIVYYFDTSPSVYVRYNDVDAFGGPTQEILEDRIISENISNINFYGNGNLEVDLTLTKSTEQVEMKSTINPRNN